MEFILSIKRNYINGTTPIQKLSGLSEYLQGPEVFIKRDDLTHGLTEGGNKVRKLEYVIADALKNGCDTLITCGAVQSNHCRLTLAAAVREGLKCQLVLEERVMASYFPQASGNNLLYNLLGAENIRVVPGGSDMMAEMERDKQELEQQGRKPYIIPGGASNEIGAMGYRDCGLEIMDQIDELGIDIDYLICASGSGGTHAGLLTGFFQYELLNTVSQSEIRQSRLTPQTPDVVGINVRAPKQQQKEKIKDLTSKTRQYAGVSQKFPEDRIACFDEYVGNGYSLPTDGMKEAVKLLASLDGILLDPVYSGKAMAGLIDMVRNGYFEANDKVLFLHTGGVPALYHYAHYFI